MRRFLIISGLITLVLLSALLPLQRAAAPVSEPVSLVIAPPPPGEVRALWVVRTSLTTPDSISEMVRRADEAGFTDLIVQVRGRGDAYYAGRWEPRAPLLDGQPQEFDPLALTIEKAHAAGLKVHAWINTFLVADLNELPQSPEHIIHKHPEWLMIPRAIGSDLYRGNPKAPNYLERLISYSRSTGGVELEGLFVSPAHPGVREQMHNIWMDVVEKYDVDGMHFDYVRYPNSQFDYSRTSLERFRGELEKTLEAKERDRLAKLAEDDPMIYISVYPERYAQFQRDQVTDIVERIYTAVKLRKPKVMVSAAVFANQTDAYEARYQDWKQWLRRGILDVACPMAYSTDTDTFARHIRNAVISASKGTGEQQVWAGIGSWLLPVEGTLEKVSEARKLGAQGFVLFSYDAAMQDKSWNGRSDYLQRMHDRLNLTDTK
jgi:uncharacterized lipoprotein YddW (UPF0748 family)